MTKSILNVECSMYYNKEDKFDKKVNLLEWLKSDKYLNQQNAVRNAIDENEQNRLKSMVPCITPCGVFSGSKTKSNLVKHTGLIAIDIDFKDNEHLTNFASLKNEFSKMSNVAYCGHSIRGKGYWLIIPIAFAEKHELHFKFIQNYFWSKNIIIDKSCNNVNRLRFYSYDAAAYYNHDAKPLMEYYKPKNPTKLNSNIGNYYKPIADYLEYNNSDDFLAILQNHGWKKDNEFGRKIYFTRPGKNGGTSAEFDYDQNVFYVFSENGAPFEANKGYNPFQVYAILEHQGNTKKARERLRNYQINKYKQFTYKGIPKPIQSVSKPVIIDTRVVDEIADNTPKNEQNDIDEKTKMLMVYKRMAIESVKKRIKFSDREKKAPNYLSCWADSMEKTMQIYGIQYHELLETISPADYMKH